MTLQTSLIMAFCLLLISSPASRFCFSPADRRSKFDKFVDKGTLLHNYAHVFELLSRLRQAVDHPYLVVHGEYRGKSIKMPTRSNADNGGSDICGICTLDILSVRDCAVNSCRHTFHRDCILEYTNEGTPVDAPVDGKGKGKKNKKSKTKDINSTSKQCPVCFLPLQVTLDLRGMGDTDEDEDDNDNDAGPAARKKSKLSSKAPKAANASNAVNTAKVTSAEPADEAEKTTCVVCMENPRDALLMPCGHMYTCMDCVKQLRTRSCPICRTSISRCVRFDRPDLTKEAVANLSQGGGRKASSDAAPLLGRSSILQKVSMVSEVPPESSRTKPAVRL